mgnify:CR=1 FL=1
MNDVTKQIQKGGDNSQQIQAGTVIIGIDEKRAREICDEKFNLIRNEFSSEALQIANERVSKFEDTLIPKMQKIDGALESFADPAFQYLISKAHRTAACTDREDDYLLLSELLLHRIEKKDSRRDCAGINRAIEIVDQITDEALSSLTVFFSVEQFNPVASTVSKGLAILDNLYGKLPLNLLSANSSWIEELDVLDAARFSTFGELKKLEEYWRDKYSGFVCTGIKNDSEKWSEIDSLLASAGLSRSILVPNELLPNFFIIPVIHKDDIKNLLFRNGTFQISLTTNQIEVLNKIYDMYENPSNESQIVYDNFKKKMDSYKNMAIVRKWWNSIPHAITITSVGRVLAHSYAKKCEPTLPDINT